MLEVQTPGLQSAVCRGRHTRATGSMKGKTKTSMKLGLTIRPKYEHDGPCRVPGFIFTPRRPIAITTSSPHVHLKEGGDAFLCVDRPGSSKRPMTRATSGHGQPIAPTWPRTQAAARLHEPVSNSRDYAIRRVLYCN